MGTVEVGLERDELPAVLSFEFGVALLTRQVRPLCAEKDRFVDSLEDA